MLEKINEEINEQLTSVKSKVFDDQEWKFNKSLIDISDGMIGTINQFNKKSLLSLNIT